MDETPRETPDTILWRLADNLKARRELKARLARLDAVIDADASSLTPLVPPDGLNVPVGRDYDRVVVSLTRDRMRGCVATLLPTVRSSDLAWPEAPEPETPLSVHPRTREQLDQLPPEKRAKAEAILARHQTPEFRERERAAREQIEAERTRRVDDTIRAVIGNSELCTVPDDRSC